MRKTNTERISDVVIQFMRQEGIETPYNQYRIVRAWPDVMGDMVAKYTNNIYIKNQTLHVQILSPSLKQNLQSEHRQIARRLNEHVGAQVIEDVELF